MHIKTRLDISNIKSQRTDDDNVVYRIYFITEGYEECRKELNIRSIPLFIIQSSIEVTPCVLNGLKRLPAYYLLSNKDLNLTCEGSDEETDRELNLKIFHDQIKAFHRKHEEFIHNKIEDILQVIDVGSEMAVAQHRAKRMRIRH